MMPPPHCGDRTPSARGRAIIRPTTLGQENTAKVAHVSTALLNIVIGLVTCIISGGSVWLWQQGRNLRVLRRKTAFFGLKPGSVCLIVMANRPENPGMSSHDDVHALVEVGALAAEMGCLVSVRSPQEFRESNGDRTEFCIGGPDSNSRARGHLASYLPGISFRPYSPSRRDSIAIIAGGERFLRAPGDREYALVAKFTPQGSSSPVILICGQTAVTNRAAIAFLKNEYREVAKMITSTESFCIMIRVAAISTYGHQGASFERDVSATAFASQ